MAIIYPKLEILYNDWFYEMVKSRCCIDIPINDTPNTLTHKFELYLNDKSTGLFAIVYIHPDEGEIEVTEFGLWLGSKDYLPKSGGKVRMVITTQQVQRVDL